jgi:GrpB-like predicted nucleotidyltransferase (UPF0157 family)
VTKSSDCGRGTTSIRKYDTRWPQEFEREAATLRSILGELVSNIEHIGSTAVPGLASKPVLDIARLRVRCRAGGGAAALEGAGLTSP